MAIKLFLTIDAPRARARKAELDEIAIHRPTLRQPKLAVSTLASCSPVMISSLESYALPR